MATASVATSHPSPATATASPFVGYTSPSSSSSNAAAAAHHHTATALQAHAAVPPTLKRRSDSSLDCQSLQSSLKRVRLSCSPGELRLQRDVGSLSTMGWGELILNGSGNVDGVCWQHRGTGAILMQDDALRLKLRLPNNVGIMWIQIPRMYPHRPPVVSRLEGNLWFERITIQESHHVPAHLLRGQLSPSSLCGATVVYNQWSPIMHIGHLLDFLISTGLSSRPNSHDGTTPPQSGNNVMTTINSSATSVINHQETQNLMDEHKMEDGNNNSNRHRHHHQQQHPSYRGGFRGTQNNSMNAMETPSSTQFPLTHTSRYLTPNRFDVGYAKPQCHYNQEQTMFSTAVPRRGNNNGAMEL